MGLVRSCAKMCPVGQWILAGHGDATGQYSTWIISEDGSYRQTIIDYFYMAGGQAWGF